MKDAMLAGFVGALLTVLAIWIAIVFIADRLTSKAKPDVRFLTIILAVLSVPAYLYLSSQYDRHRHEQARVIADNSVQRFEEICAEKRLISLKRVVQQTVPVDIRVVEADRSGHFELSIDPKRACWFSKYGTRCKRANIRSIEWSRDDNSSSKPRFFRFSSIGMRDTNGFSSQYGLYVFAKGQIEPLIDGYSVSIRTVETGEVLAETNIYQMKGLRYCPEIDVHLADMLSQVFPLPQNSLTGR